MTTKFAYDKVVMPGIATKEFHKSAQFEALLKITQTQSSIQKFVQWSDV